MSFLISMPYYDNPTFIKSMNKKKFLNTTSPRSWRDSIKFSAIVVETLWFHRVRSFWYLHTLHYCWRAFCRGFLDTVVVTILSGALRRLIANIIFQVLFALVSTWRDRGLAVRQNHPRGKRIRGTEKSTSRLAKLPYYAKCGCSSQIPVTLLSNLPIHSFNTAPSSKTSGRGT